MIYLDHNATTPIDKSVLEAMLPFLTDFYANASSLYKLGRIVRSALETAREQVAALVGVTPLQVIFTSGATEANNLALQDKTFKTPLAISAIEHPSVTETALARFHCPQIIAVNPQGIIDIESLNSLNLSRQAMVSIMLANNETGVIQPIADYVDKLKGKGIIIHTDATQAMGKIPVAFNQLGVQRLSLSGHKFYGPKGCGALIIEKQAIIKPMQYGGGQEQNLRGGTENIAAIIGLGKAAELALSTLVSRAQHLLNLRQTLETALLKIPKLTIFARHQPRLPNTVQFAIEGIDGEMLLMQLDQKNIAVSSASACSTFSGKPSSVLTAMGVAPALAKGAIRVSLGKDNTLNEINTFINTLHTIIN
jgi:cysteine desulfurase